jgi:hypothetical protein
MTEFSCRLSTIHVSKDEQRELSPGSFMTLKIRGKQLQRSVECSAHDFQRVGAVDIILAAVEWEHSSSLLICCLRSVQIGCAISPGTPSPKFVMIVSPVRPMS